MVVHVVSFQVKHSGKNRVLVQEVVVVASPS